MTSIIYIVLLYFKSEGSIGVPTYFCPASSIPEMQGSGPAARPDPKFRPGRAFCGARTKSAGLMPGLKEAITMYYALAAGLCAVFERRWPGLVLGSADFVRCRPELGLGFWILFCISTACLSWQLNSLAIIMTPKKGNGINGSLKTFLPAHSG